MEKKQKYKNVISELSKIISEIDIQTPTGMGSRVGAMREFPIEKKPGSTLNIRVKGGPNEFPK